MLDMYITLKMELDHKAQFWIWRAAGFLHFLKHFKEYATNKIRRREEFVWNWPMILQHNVCCDVYNVVRLNLSRRTHLQLISHEPGDTSAAVSKS